MAVNLSNPHLVEEDDDVLYHLGLSKKGDKLPLIFADTKIVCCGGSISRMSRLYEQLVTKLCLSPFGNLSNSERFVLYKAGPVIAVSHGIGVPSMWVMLCEVIKLLHHAGAKDVRCIRVGTSGGIGVEPGTVCISSGAMNGLFEQSHHSYVLGERRTTPVSLSAKLSAELTAVTKSLDLPVANGYTLCTDDFYEGQARLDGPFCDYTAEDKMAFLKKCQDKGIVNIEMEASGFAAVCTRANLEGAIVCAALINRLEGDQVLTPKAHLLEFEQRPIDVILRFVKTSLNIKLEDDNNNA